MLMSLDRSRVKRKPKVKKQKNPSEPKEKRKRINHTSLSGLSRAAVFFLLAVYLVAVLVWGIGMIKDKKADQAINANNERVAALQQAAAGKMPGMVSEGNALCVASYYDADGNPVSLQSLGDSPQVLLFWNQNSGESTSLLGKLIDLQSACDGAGYELVLVWTPGMTAESSDQEQDLTDSSDETADDQSSEYEDGYEDDSSSNDINKSGMASAQEYLNTISYLGKAAYDKDGAAYKLLGIQALPTTIFLNANGTVAGSLGGAINTAEDFQSLIDYVKNKQE